MTTRTAITDLNFFQLVRLLASDTNESGYEWLTDQDILDISRLYRFTDKDGVSNAMP